MTTLAPLVREQHVLVCCGTGGVGKTTTAAVLALGAARAGRDAVVVTIDPAKRLADTLGLEALGNITHEIDRGRWDPEGRAPATGRLSALMLDSRSTFDALVNRYARGPEQAERILENRFYRNIAGALSGTQEYMAMEKLYELHEEGGHDVIVVDTPPTRHALDFLEAPARLTRLLDNRIFRFLMVPARTGVRVAGVAVQAFFRAVGRVVGTEAIEDVVAFFRAFEGMEQGFRERASSVTALLAQPTTAFVLVTSPRRDAVEEAQFFADRLRGSELTVAGLVVNRVHPDFAQGIDTEGLSDRLAFVYERANTASGESRGAAARLGRRYENLVDYASLARTERRQLDAAAARIGAAAVAHVPSLAHDIVDFAALDAVAAYVVGPGPASTLG
jgi:anion-transporting  ArsA/GET3 family ATPase